MYVVQDSKVQFNWSTSQRPSFAGLGDAQLRIKMDTSDLEITHFCNLSSASQFFRGDSPSDRDVVTGGVGSISVCQLLQPVSSGGPQLVGCQRPV